MTVVFDAEPLLAFSFDEPGAAEVEHWLNRVYDSEIDGYVTTVNLAEFRYISARQTSATAADAHINDLREMGVTECGIDDLWKSASDLKASYSPSLGDAYAVAAAKAIDTDDEQNVTLLVGADDDYDVFEETAGFSHLIERFRNNPA
ncbi:Predicted nucleic acid-binding protein, contains PIN domain [Haladaptatus litoreus]|uniref:Predicted nucleic acid-binding protein, contains PIN domain n=1 Tax=Haladaptatus litoreus TaxID=553468 RepID=A0A1N7EAN6_9EURY|nr:PIN domain-containing protein [Haladaptatus litoreus]SIR85106.1 Predicted nucleic acid-binding protein, contains PIN domain [Haladaptatus litoreus]